MKTMKIISAFAISLLLTSFVKAQDCDYFSMSKGMILAYQNTDSKGKVTSTTRTTCLDVSTVGQAIIYKVKSEFADAKGKNQSTREFEMKCEGGKFYVDMRNFIDPKSMEGFKDVEVNVDGNDMEYPSGLSAGQTLPDAVITISAATGGISLMKLVVTITNRKVVGIESVTVPAGTFECYKITYNMETKMMIKINTVVSEYVNMGIGNVKTETFDKKGNLSGTTQLIELKK
jgi:hypothetical protein